MKESMSDQPPITQPGEASPEPAAYRRRADVRVSNSRPGPGNVYLKAATGELFAFDDQEHFLWESLDGAKSFAQIGETFRSRFGFGIRPQEFSAFLEELATARLVERVAEHGGIADTDAQGAITPSVAVSEPASASQVAVASREAGDGSRPSRPTKPMNFILFNPNRLFAALAVAFRPVRYVTWLLVPLTLLAILIVFKHEVRYVSDFENLITSIPYWPSLYFAEHALNALSRVVQGTVIRGYGGSVEHFRVQLFTCWVPRCFVDESSLEKMPRGCQLWVHASTLLLRLAMFDIGTIVWVMYYQTHSVIAKIGLGFGQLGFWTCILCAFPLLPQDGYRWLATSLDQPDLQSRAFRYLGLRLRGHPAPAAMTGNERWGLLFFAVGTALCTAIWAGSLTVEFDLATVSTLQGLGVVLVLGQFAISAVYIYLVLKFKVVMRALRRDATSRWRSRQMVLE